MPDDLDPAEVLSLAFIHMTAYQLLHRTAKVKRGETVLVHGACGQGGHRGDRGPPVTRLTTESSTTWARRTRYSRRVSFGACVSDAASV